MTVSTIREVGMRDGLQSIAEIMPTETKLAWLDAEYAAGVREIEVSSFVPPKLLPQLADAEAVVRHALTLPGLTVSALIPNSRGAERGLALGVHEMNFVLSVSEGHNRVECPPHAPTKSIEDFRRVVALCRERAATNRPRINCGLATAFGCTIEGDVDEDRVRRIANEVAEAGADGIILADTVGYGQPAAIERVFRRVIADVAPLPVGGAFPRHARPRPRQCAGRARRRLRAPSTPRWAGSAAAPTRRAPPATSSPRISAFMFEAMGFDTGIDLDRLVGGARDRRTRRCRTSSSTAPSPRPACRKQFPPGADRAGGREGAPWSFRGSVRMGPDPSPGSEEWVVGPMPLSRDTVAVSAPSGCGDGRAPRLRLAPEQFEELRQAYRYVERMQRSVRRPRDRAAEPAHIFVHPRA